MPRPDGKNSVSASNQRTSQGGFALTELISTIAVVGVVLTAMAVGQSCLNSDWSWNHKNSLDLARANEETIARTFYALAISPDGRHTVTGSLDQFVRVWNTATGVCEARLAAKGSPIKAVAISPNGQDIVAATANGEMTVWRDFTGACDPQTTPAHARSVQAIAFSPDGTRIVSGCMQGWIRIWDAATLEPMGQVSIGVEVRGISFSPDGSRFVSGSVDGQTRMWDAQTQQLLWSTTLHENTTVDCVAFSKDGIYFASGGRDASVVVGSVADGSLVRRLKGHANDVKGVAFSPDGEQLASCSWDRTIRLWDVASGEVCGKFTGHERLVRVVEFMPDGRHLLSCSWDATVRVWSRKENCEVRRFDPL